MGKYKFYRTGDVVADTGIVSLYDILNNMKSKYAEDLEIDLKSNCLVINNLDPEMLYDYLLNCEIFEFFLSGIKSELEKKGMEKEIIEMLNINNFVESINNSDVLSSKDKKLYKDKFTKKYFPYVRNSGKYGANSGSEENFHQNLKQLLNIVFEINCKSEEEQKKLLNDFDPIDENCAICHKNVSTRLDITHKEEEKERINSKYNYTFFGPEESTFNNYGKVQNNICFECEFLNLMYLLYINTKKPLIVGYVDDLYFLKFINDNLLLKKRLYKDSAFYLKLGKMKAKNIRIYDVTIDANKGIILALQSVTDYEKLISDVELLKIVDNYYYIKEPSTMRERNKKYIKYKNYEGLRNIFLTNLLNFEKEENREVMSNIINYQQYIRILNKLEERRDIVNDKGFYKLGENLRKNMIISSTEEPGKDNRKNIALRIAGFLKSDDREGLFNFLTHLIIVNGVEMPSSYSEVILDKSKKNQLHYCIGKLLEGFLK